MRIAVIGGAGVAGRHTVKALRRAGHDSLRLIPSWRSGLFGVEAAGEILLPGPEARLAPTTFDAWLTAQTATARFLGPAN